MLHDLVEFEAWVGNQSLQGSDNLSKVVRRHVGCHSNRNSARAIDKQIWECCGKYRWFEKLGVIVWLEADYVLIQGLIQ